MLYQCFCLIIDLYLDFDYNNGYSDNNKTLFFLLRYNFYLN